MVALAPLLTTFDSKGYMYVVHTERYLVSQVDLNTGEIKRKFSRKYAPRDYMKKTFKNYIPS